jgi:hypothetical protein
MLIFSLLLLTSIASKNQSFEIVQDRLKELEENSKNSLKIDTKKKKEVADSIARFTLINAGIQTCFVPLSADRFQFYLSEIEDGPLEAAVVASLHKIGIGRFHSKINEDKSIEIFQTSKGIVRTIIVYDKDTDSQEPTRMRSRLSGKKQQNGSNQIPKNAEEWIVHWFFTGEEDTKIVNLPSKSFLDLASVLYWEKHRLEMLQPFKKYAHKYTDKTFVLDIEKEKDGDLIIVRYKATLHKEGHKPTELMKCLLCRLKLL